MIDVVPFLFIHVALELEASDLEGSSDNLVGVCRVDEGGGDDLASFELLEDGVGEPTSPAPREPIAVLVGGEVMWGALEERELEPRVSLFWEILLFVELVEDEQLLERLKKRFEERNYPFTENNRKQATFPAGATVFASEVGSAAGFGVSIGGAVVVSMPGVPRELDWFLERHLDDWLVRAGGAARPTQLKRSLHFFGIGESQLEDKLSGVDAMCAARGVQIAWRADFPTLTVSLFGAASEDLEAIVAFIEDRAGAYVIGQDEEGLFERLARLLTEAGATVSAAKKP